MSNTKDWEEEDDEEVEEEESFSGEEDDDTYSDYSDPEGFVDDISDAGKMCI